MLVGPLVPTILALAAPNVLNVSVQSLVLLPTAGSWASSATAELAALALVFPARPRCR